MGKTRKTAKKDVRADRKLAKRLRKLKTEDELDEALDLKTIENALAGIPDSPSEILAAYTLNRQRLERGLEHPAKEAVREEDLSKAAAHLASFYLVRIGFLTMFYENAAGTAWFLNSAHPQIKTLKRLKGSHPFIYRVAKMALGYSRSMKRQRRGGGGGILEDITIYADLHGNLSVGPHKVYYCETLKSSVNINGTRDPIRQLNELEKFRASLIQLAGEMLASHRGAKDMDKPYLSLELHAETGNNVRLHALHITIDQDMKDGQPCELRWCRDDEDECMSVFHPSHESAVKMTRDYVYDATAQWFSEVIFQNPQTERKRSDSE